MMALVQDQQFATWENFSQALEDWSIDEYLKYTVQALDRSRKIIKCAAAIEASCPFHLRAFYNTRDEYIQIGAFDARHTCLGTTALPRPITIESRQRWLARALPETITITHSTTPAEIIAAVQRKHNVTIKYDAAYRAKRAILSDQDSSGRAQYQMLPDYLSRIKTTNPDAYVHLISNTTTDVQQFEGLFICPSTSATTFRLCRCLIVLDETFTKGAYKQVLLLAVGIDG